MPLPLREHGNARATHFTERLVDYQRFEQLQINEVVSAVVPSRLPDWISTGVNLLCDLPRQGHTWHGRTIRQTHEGKRF